MKDVLMLNREVDLIPTVQWFRYQSSVAHLLLTHSQMMRGQKGSPTGSFTGSHPNGCRNSPSTASRVPH